MNKLTFSLLIFFVGTLVAHAASYPMNIFKSSKSFFSVFEDPYGRILAAGEGGLSVLVDGRLQVRGLSDKSLNVVRTDAQGNIYVANSREVLKVEGDSIEYFSLAGINDIIIANSGVYGHQEGRVLKFGNDIIDYNYDDVLYVGQLNRDIIIQRAGEGLFILAANRFRKINESEEYASEPLLDVLELSNGKFLLLFQEGAVVYDGDNFIPWLDEGVQWVRKLAIKHSVSTNQGIFISDENNSIFQLSETGELVQVIVPGGVINDLSTDSKGDLWVPSRNSIFNIEASSAINMIDVQGSVGKAATMLEEDMLLGTDKGLYSTTKVSFINGGLPRELFLGSVNNVFCALGQCFISSENGLYFRDGNRSQQVSGGYKSNNAIMLEDEGTTLLIEACDSGLNLYEYKYGRWSLLNHLYGIEEEVMQVVRDEEGRLWASTISGGIRQLNYDGVLRTINPTKYNVSAASGIFLVNGKPVVTAPDGIYELNAKLNRYEISDNYAELIGANSDLKYLYQDEQENIWYIADKEAGVLKVNDLGVKKKIQKIIIPELHAKLSLKSPFITSFSEEKLLIGRKEGFILLDKAEVESENFLVHLSALRNYDKKGEQIRQFFPKWGQKADLLTLSKNSREVELDLTSTMSLKDKIVSYTYNVNDSGWSTKSPGNTLRMELPGGTNNVKVRADYGINSVSNTLVIPIFIPQDWYMMENNQYLMAGAVALVLLLLLVVLSAIAKARKKRFLQAEKQLADTKAEMQELKDKNEILSSQLISALNDGDISLQLEKLQKENSDPDVKKSIKKLLKKLKISPSSVPSSVTPDPEFISRLKLNFPQLTKKDIRLCSLLKMDLTTKDIAPILDITVRGVEISRYRLRKKLELENEVILTEFLKEI